MFIDEVDKTSDNQIFLHFLGMLRNKYLKRQEDMDYTFKSVILAGVYDIKNLKLKLRADVEKKYNSPWNTHVGNEENGCLQTLDDCPWDCKAAPYNIAADFDVDMSFSPKEIATMLSEYKNQFIKDGKLDMPHILTKFQEIMKAEYRSEDEKFLEKQGI